MFLAKSFTNFWASDKACWLRLSRACSRLAHLRQIQADREDALSKTVVKIPRNAPTLFVLQSKKARGKLVQLLFRPFLLGHTIHGPDNADDFALFVAQRRINRIEPSSFVRSSSRKWDVARESDFSRERPFNLLEHSHLTERREKVQRMFSQNVFFLHASILFKERIPVCVPELTVVDDNSFLRTCQDLAIEFAGFVKRRFRVFPVRDVRECGDYVLQGSFLSELGHHGSMNPQGLV